MAFFGVEPGELRLVRVHRDGVVPVHEGYVLELGRDHVVAVGQADVLVESVLEWEIVLLGGSKVPFAVDGRVIALSLKCFCQSYLLGMDTSRGVRIEHPAEAGADRVAAGHEPVAAGGGCRRGAVVVAEPYAVQGHPVKVGCLDVGIAGDAEVAVTHVIGIDDYYVGPVGIGWGCRRGRR